MPYGVWDEHTQLSFISKYGASRVDAGGEVKINVVPLDEVLVGEPVTFIKMDIEGSELRALKGARKLITKNHPKLAICVYHKNEDFIQIPQYLHKLVPEYKFYMKHH